jgi:hypothetical protein
VSSTRTIAYETPADGFGDHATDEDRWSFCEFVERRVEGVYQGYTCFASWGTGVLESRVMVDSSAPDAPRPQELRSWIGNELWNEWCALGVQS